MSASRISPVLRVVDVRTRRVLDRRRQPADHRVARVFRTPVGILGRRRRVLREDRVLEARRLERALPALDAALQIRNPLGGRGRIDPVDDRLHRLRQRGRRVLLFETVARDVAALRRAVLVLAVVHLPHREVADALVEQARRHRLLGQQHHAVVHDDAGAAGTGRRAAAPARGRARRAGGQIGRRVVGLRRLHLDVLGERHRAIDERPRRVERARAHPCRGR